MRHFSKLKIGTKSFLLSGVYNRERCMIKITGSSCSLDKIKQLLEETTHLWRVEFEGDGYRESIRGKFVFEINDNIILLKNFRNLKLKNV